MKQVLQSLKDGKTKISEVPRPSVGKGKLLVATHTTLVSSGTERMLVEFGKAGLIGKARQQPDKVRMVLQKIRTDGLKPTVEAVLNKLDQPLPLGYCNVGEVVAVGSGVSGFQVGDLIVSNGKHAEVVAVPQNLCARIPEGVNLEEAAFTVLGAIGLQGVRLAKPTLGESFAVMGLGLIGLITVQLLKANGCRVIGFDFDKDRLRRAREYGAAVVDLGKVTDPVSEAMRFSRGRGIDGVLVTASTSSNEPMTQAAQMSRQRGRIVLVGVAGLELSRADYYEKELSFQVSCSYGPGRYDANYEEKGVDYPLGYVRWTEQRNFEAILDLLSAAKLEMQSLVTHRFAIDEAELAYDVVAGSEPSLGIVLRYPNSKDAIARQNITNTSDSVSSRQEEAAKLGFIGAGNYAGAVLIPAFRKTNAELVCIASENGLTANNMASKYGIRESSTDVEGTLSSTDINAVIISTRHDSHADLVCRALSAGKHVFIEKPLALTLLEIDRIEEALEEANSRFGARILMVGFNRRFAPLVQKLKSALADSTAPIAMTMTVNAGAIPPDHWTQDPEIGGGRIIGEACHFIDLMRYLAASPIEAFDMVTMDTACKDSVSIILRFANGSIGNVNYFANGHKDISKERLEVFSDGGVLQLDNFRKLRGHGGNFSGVKDASTQDKGHKDCAAAFADSIRRGQSSPIPLGEIFEVSQVVVQLAG